MRRLLAPAVAAVLLAVTGCSGDDDGDDDAGNGDADAGVTTTTTGEPSPDDAGAPTITLLEPGAEPRAELRYAYVAGDVRRYATSTVVDQSVDGTSPGPITTTIELTTEVVSATPEQSMFTATFREPTVVTEPGTPEAIAEAAAAGSAVLTDAVATVTVDGQGNVLDLTIDLEDAQEAALGARAAELADDLHASLEQQSVLLPAEPVGVGARWQVDLTLTTAGVTSRSRQVVTLVGFDADGIDLEFTTTGTFADAATGTSTGSGTMRLDLGSFYPHLDSTSVNELVAGDSEIDQTLTQSIRAL